MWKTTCSWEWFVSPGWEHYTSQSFKRLKGLMRWRKTVWPDGDDEQTHARMDGQFLDLQHPLLMDEWILYWWMNEPLQKSFFCWGNINQHYHTWSLNQPTVTLPETSLPTIHFQGVELSVAVAGIFLRSLLVGHMQENSHDFLPAPRNSSAGTSSPSCRLQETEKMLPTLLRDSLKHPLVCWVGKGVPILIAIDHFPKFTPYLETNAGLLILIWTWKRGITMFQPNISNFHL